MSEEEKKAIENLKEVVDLYNDECLITTDYDFKSIEILLNLIEKQEKEIEELKKKNQDVSDRIEYYLVGNMRLDVFEVRNRELRKLEKMLEE